MVVRPQSAVCAAEGKCYTTLPSSSATAFERGLIIATGTETRAPRSSHFALLFVDHRLTRRRHHAPAASQIVELSAFVRRRRAPGGHHPLGTASKEQAQRPGTPALGRSAAPAWGPRWLPQHCGSHARTVVQCAHSGGVGLGTRPLVRSQRTVRRYPYPPGPLLSPTLGSTGVGPWFMLRVIQSQSSLGRGSSAHRPGCKF